VIRVAVLAGGPSSERDISLQTGAAVMEHVPRDRIEPMWVEILADGRWAVEEAAPAPAWEALREFAERGVRVVFPALHGPFGEDGTVQGFLETAGLAYVGSGVGASAIAMDKTRAREVAAAHGVPLPNAVEIGGVTVSEALERVLERLAPPVVVKAPVGGSSLEVTIAPDREALAAALDQHLAAPGGRALVEERIPGPEITCAVLGNASVGEEPVALPPILIRPRGSDWFDYATKYDPDGVDEICPAPVPGELVEEIDGLARRVHRAIRADGLTRADFIVPEGGPPRFLEINTLPGLTEVSLCPKAARVAGIEFPELLHRLVTMALSRDAARRGVRS
jgi:D-alanine-D-alanine ligase